MSLIYEQLKGDMVLMNVWKKLSYLSAEKYKLKHNAQLVEVLRSSDVGGDGIDLTWLLPLLLGVIN